MRIPDPAMEEQGAHPVRSPLWKQIAASLDVAATACLQHYARAQPLVPVVPLVISSGGTFHKTFHEALQILIPDGFHRRQAIMDISIALVRGRAQAFHLQ